MAVLTNTMLQGSSAVEEAADDDYQVKKSLIFSEDQTQYLQWVPKIPGDRRRWTFSAWVKLGKLEDNGYIFAARGDTNNRLYIKYNSDGTLYGYTGNSNSKQFATTRKLRDPTAWFHLVWVWDSPNDTERDRQVVWINGERTTNAETNNYSQNFEGAINDNIEHRLCNAIHQNELFDGYLADVHFIDGLALSPAAFGKFDSKGVWGARAFSPPAPNDGTTWSGKVSTDNGSYTSGYEATKAFDGLGSSTWASPANGGADKWIAATNLGFEGISLITVSCWTTKLEINGKILHTSTGSDITKTFIITDFDSVKLYGKADGSKAALYYLEVDGVMLVDGQTDPTTRNNPNDGRTWSSYLSATGGINNPDRTFNGLAPNAGSAGALTYGVSQGGTITFAPTGGIAYKHKVELYTDQGSNYTVNGGSSQSFGPATGQSSGVWYTVASGEGTLNSLTWTPQNSNYYPSSAAMRIDGQILIDGAADNSFHFKFEDPGTIGKNSFTKSITGTTNGLPFYNTDSSGQTKESGYRADSSAGTTDGTGLVLAIPGDVLTDEHDHVNTGSSAKTITNTEGVIHTANSRYYGKCIHLNGKSAKLTTTSDSSDFDTGTFTFECWYMSLENTSTSKTIVCTKETGGGSGAIELGVNQNYLFCYTGSSQIMTTSNSAGVQLKTGNWHHIAVTRDGTTWRWFIDGTLLHSNATGVSGSTDGCYFGYASTAGGTPSDRYIKGNYQDIKFYKGVCKYNAAFEVPNAPDWAGQNLNPGGDVNYSAGGSGSTNSGQGFDKMFNGNLADANIVGSSGAWDDELTVTFNPAITVNTAVEVLVGSNVSQYKINSGSYTTETHATGQWHSLGFTGTMTTLTIKGDQSSNSAARCGAVRVDGTILVDSKESDTCTDSPTNYGTDTGKGGEVRSNYCTMNRLDTHADVELEQGNLYYKREGAWKHGRGTFGMSTGKWYFEGEAIDDSGTPHGIVGIANKDANFTENYGGTGNPGIHAAYSNATSLGGMNMDGSWTGNVNFTAGNYFGVAVDMDAGTVRFYRNGVIDSQATTIDFDGPFFPWVGSHNVGWIMNFGQRAFRMTAPTGHKALCTANIDDTFTGGDVNDPSKFFDTELYEGTGSSLSVNTINFSPDLLWIKSRDDQNHNWMAYDRIRGNNYMMLNLEDDDASTSTLNTSLDSDGYTISTNSNYNTANDNYISYVWDAGTAASGANNNGSINISAGDQWVNTTAGFSITKYTSTGSSGATVGHGLNVPPEFMIIKSTNANGAWGVYHKSIGLPASTDGGLVLNTDAGTNTASDWWASTNPTNDVFSLGNKDTVNPSGSKTMICYAWTPIAGFSSFGSYTGNGSSSDGTFHYVGFRPAFLLVKGTSNPRHWQIYDTSREPYNVMNTNLKVNNSEADSSSSNHNMDMLSNGFKFYTASNNRNASNETYVYAAFAEHPFKTARAR